MEIIDIDAKKSAKDGVFRTYLVKALERNTLLFGRTIRRYADKITIIRTYRPKIFVFSAHIPLSADPCYLVALWYTF